MALFPLSGVLRGLSGCDVHKYVSPENLVRPCSTKKLLISESDTRFAYMNFMDGHYIVSVHLPPAAFQYELALR
jgi:hypothetical protein